MKSNSQKNSQTEQENGQDSKKSLVRKWAVRGLIIIAIIGAGIYFTPIILHYLSHASTDDAYITGTVVPISPQVMGKVTAVYIVDNQIVKAGDPLFDIEKDDYMAMVRQAENSVARMISEKKQMEAALTEAQEMLKKSGADLESAMAQQKFALKEKNRYKELSKTQFVPQSKSDQAESRWKTARAAYKAGQADVSKAEAEVQSMETQLKTQTFQIEEGRAALSIAQINLERTSVKAPLDGQIAKKNVDPGKYVQPGQPVMSIASLEDIWVVANFKETDINDIRIGQPVDIRVDAYPGVTFKGRVKSLQPGTGAVFSLIPPENATGNFVKVVQRVPVKIVFESKPDPSYVLIQGLSVIPYINIRAKGK